MSQRVERDVGQAWRGSSARRIIASWLPISAIVSSAPMQLARADREIDRAEAVGAAIDEIAEEDDRAPRAPARLAALAASSSAASRSGRP